MALIVQKFGGSSVADRDCLFRVAKIVAATKDAGNSVVVVVSAQGDTTDDLLEKLSEVTDKPVLRERDSLLAAGEQMSSALLACALIEMGYSALSLSGRQAGFYTDRNHTRARIKRVDGERIENELAKNQIVIVAGFQGINSSDDTTTLGRGGSDTSAVAIAAALKADRCQIFTDVEGVFTCDPRIVPNAKKLDEITFDEMLELASLGAQVLNNRSVELAKKFGIELEVLSSITNKPGTIVREETDEVEGMLIKGVAKDTNVAVVSVIGVKDEPGISFKLFSILAQHKINVDIILQSVGRDGTKDITFTVPGDEAENVKTFLEEHRSRFGGTNIVVSDDVAKVSIVGAGMQSYSGVASKMFEALYEAGINIRMISTSEIKISVLISKEGVNKAVAAVHDAFIN